MQPHRNLRGPNLRGRRFYGASFGGADDYVQN